jgi:hypothetical protein
MRRGRAVRVRGALAAAARRRHPSPIVMSDSSCWWCFAREIDTPYVLGTLTNARVLWGTGRRVLISSLTRHQLKQLRALG